MAIKKTFLGRIATVTFMTPSVQGYKIVANLKDKARLRLVSKPGVSLVIVINNEVECNTAALHCGMFSNYTYNLVYASHAEIAYQLYKGKSTILQVNFDSTLITQWSRGNVLLKKFCTAIKTGTAAKLTPQNSVVTPEMLTMVHQLFSNKECASTRLWDSGGKKLLKLALTQSRMKKAPSKPALRQRHTALKLEYVKTHLTENFLKPGSLTDIAKKSGLNTFNLKQGFKKTYQTTVFGYVREYKLQLARKLLKAEKLEEVARKTGYNYLSNFIIAYKRRFGQTPGHDAEHKLYKETMVKA